MSHFEITHGLHNSEHKQQQHKKEEEEEDEEEEDEEEDEEEEEEEEEEEDEEREEALSLCDLPLSEDAQNHVTITFETASKHTVRSSSEPSDLFEFFSPDLSTDYICSADDIIFAGKLIPLYERNHNSSPIQSKISKQTAFRKRSESLSVLYSSVSLSNREKSKLVRNSHSLDYRQLHRPSNSPPPSQAPAVEKYPLVKSDPVVHKKMAKPRWYVFMFGMGKFQAEMELNDIKTRQFRRSPMRKLPANPSAGRTSGSWKLLKALSCKDYASVAATASFCVPTT